MAPTASATGSDLAGLAELELGRLGWGEPDDSGGEPPSHEGDDGDDYDDEDWGLGEHHP